MSDDASDFGVTTTDGLVPEHVKKFVFTSRKTAPDGTQSEERLEIFILEVSVNGRRRNHKADDSTASPSLLPSLLGQTRRRESSEEPLLVRSSAATIWPEFEAGLLVSRKLFHVKTWMKNISRKRYLLSLNKG